MKLLVSAVALLLMVSQMTAIEEMATQLHYENSNGQGSWIMPRAFSSVKAMAYGALSTKPESGMIQGHVQTDKPIYSPGEIMFIRGVYLESFNFHAVEQPVMQGRGRGSHRSHQPSIDFIVMNEGTEEILCEGTASARLWSLFYAQCEIPENATGGKYSIRFESGSNESQKRFVSVRHYTKRDFDTVIKLAEDSYAPDDLLNFSIRTARVNGQPWGESKFDVSLIVDGDQTESIQKSTTSSADVTASWDFNWRLPSSLFDSAQIRVTVRTDNGQVETKTKNIPLARSAVTMTFYPEMGPIALGVENRVYYEALTHENKPATFIGALKEQCDLNHDAESLELVSSAHQGRGSFRFTPKKSCQYFIEFTEPAAFRGAVSYISADLFVENIINMSVDYDVSTQKLTMTAASEVNKDGYVIITRGDGKIWDTPFKVSQEGTSIEVNNLSDLHPSGGVLTCTVFELKENDPNDKLHLKMLGSRAFYLPPKDWLEFELTFDSPNYQPGDKVDLIVKPKLNSGEQVGKTFITATVSDISAFNELDSSQLPGDLLSLFHLENEIEAESLEFSADYLSRLPTDLSPQLCQQNVDLLLGVQGWRRFIYIDPNHSTNQLKSSQLDEAEKDRLRAKLNVLSKSLLYTERSRNKKRQNGLLLMDIEEMDEEEMYEEEDEMEAESYEFLDENDGIFGMMQDFDLVSSAMASGGTPPEGEAPKIDDSSSSSSSSPPPPMDKNNFYGFEIDPIAFVEKYRHRRRPDYDPDVRIDFTETIYWEAGSAVEKGDHLDVSFWLNDSVTTFLVQVEGFDGRGNLGSHRAVFKTAKPFYIDAKVPTELTAGDQLLARVFMVNQSSKDLEMNVEVPRVEGYSAFVSSEVTSTQTESQSQGFAEVAISAKAPKLQVPLRMDATSRDEQNSTERSTLWKFVDIVSPGVPQEITQAGFLTSENALEFSRVLPESYVPDSLSGSLKVYLSPVDNLYAALKRLIREPSGCFEQTSVTTYPLLLVYRYIKVLYANNIEDAEIKAQLNDLKEKIKRGYNRMLTYETSSGGYEWFGQAPGHESLTAFGLMLIQSIENEILENGGRTSDRVNKWLSGRQDDRQEGFKLSTKTMDTFGRASKDTSDAYILWSLATMGVENLDDEIEYMIKRSFEVKDPYIYALTADLCFLTGRQGDGIKLGNLLKDFQVQKGFIKGARESITRSSGQSLTLEATALAAIAWMKQPEQYFENIRLAVDFIVKSSKDGMYGSTQSTVLSLMALLDYHGMMKALPSQGTLKVTINDALTREIPIDFSKEGKTQEGIDHFMTSSDIQEILGSQNMDRQFTLKVELTTAGDSKSSLRIPYSLAVDYYDTAPGSSDGSSQVGIEVAIKDNSPDSMPLSLSSAVSTPSEVISTSLGEILSYHMTLTNRSTDAIGMAVVRLGFPGNLQPDFSKLDDLVKAGSISYYETLAREVIIYRTSMVGQQALSWILSFEVKYDGTFTSPPTKVYTYYGDDVEWILPYSIRSG